MLMDARLTLFGFGLTAATAAYACAAALALGRAGRRDRVDPDLGPRQVDEPAELPPVTVLKPLCGAEIGLYENLRGFCLQDHPDFQLLCGVRDSADPAIAVVRRLQREFPRRDIELVIDPRVHGANLKVSNLINLLPRVRHEWVVLSDSDIAVEPDYLRQVSAPLSDPQVGVVTCLYRGIARGGIWSRLGAQFIDEWFAPSVRVSNLLGSTRFSFGATLAFRREALAAAGGFDALTDRLADDFWLGEFTRRAGLRTVLSPVVVGTDVTDSSLSRLWAHELRWLRTIRAAAPLGFAFSFITFTIPCLILGLVLGRSSGCELLGGVGLAARLRLHFGHRRGQPWRSAVFSALLIPFRDTLSLMGWAAAHAGSSVRWRDQVLDAFADPALAEASSARTIRPAMRSI
jgi:ceramide glucosyltransferase